jgi:hypothetical protein
MHNNIRQEGAKNQETVSCNLLHSRGKPNSDAENCTAVKVARPAAVSVQSAYQLKFAAVQSTISTILH